MHPFARARFNWQYLHCRIADCCAMVLVSATARRRARSSTESPAGGHYLLIKWLVFVLYFSSPFFIGELDFLSDLSRCTAHYSALGTDKFVVNYAGSVHRLFVQKVTVHAECTRHATRERERQDCTHTTCETNRPVDRSVWTVPS